MGSNKLDPIHLEQIKVSSKRCGKVRICAANTNSEKHPKRNKIRIRIILNIKKPLNFLDEKWPGSSFYGLYDGEGGKACAEFLKENLHLNVFSDTNFPYRPKQAIANGFLLTENQYFTKSEENYEFSGSTALTCLIIGNNCFVSHLGDSRALLSIEKGSKVVQLTQDHSLSNESEKNRILDFGGKIISSYTIENGAKMVKGPYRIVPGNSEVSRIFGNFYAKLEKYGGKPNVILSNPEIKSFHLRNNFDFILMGTKGIFEKISNEEVVEIV